jgi:hypothetical protein
MNESLTVVIERNFALDADFVTEPYEVAWAREARWFLVLDGAPDAQKAIRLDTEISPDGLNWCSLEETESKVVDDRVTSWRIREFGGWLRLRGTVTGTGDAKGSLYLALKA